MASVLRNTLDRLQHFQNRLVENKKSVNSQILLSGQWSFSIDSNDNMLIKNGTTLHTTITPSGNITAPALKIPNGPSIAGSAVSGLTDRDIASAPRSYLATHTNITGFDAPPAAAPGGYVCAVSRNGLWQAASNFLDGSVVYGSVRMIKLAPDAVNDTTLTPPSGTLDATMFGSALHLNADGSRVYIGEPIINSVHIFARQKDGSWVLESTIVGPKSGAMFGASLAVANDSFLVIGAKATSSNNGAIYIYERSSTGWTLKTTSVGNASIANYQLGVNVAISDDASIVIASSVGSSALYVNSGSVEVYTKATTSIWGKIKTLISPVTPGPSTLFGGAIEISDDYQYLFIGDAEMPIGVASGSVYVYINSNDDWIHLKTFSNGRNANARFGRSIKERNGMMIVGSPGDNDNGATANDGRVMVYKRQRDDWIYSHLIEPPLTASFFGWSMSMATADLFLISGPFSGNGSVISYQPDGYSFSGVTLKTGTLLPTTANVSDIGGITEQYTELYVQNTPTTTSDRNKKKNIRSVERGLDFIKKLNPVVFEWKENDTGKHLGFIGQDVAAVAGPNSGITVHNESRFMIRPSEMLASLVATYQQLYTKVELLESRA